MPDCAAEPHGRDGSDPAGFVVAFVTLSEPLTVRALRIVIESATGPRGVPALGAVPVVREISAYRADDGRPILAAPWVLSVNANPSAQARAAAPDGDWVSDVYHARFLQRRFAPLLPALYRDDRYARSLGPRGELLDAPPSAAAGEVLESIEGDDPQLDAQLLAGSSPPPITVLSGSNDWDYSPGIGPDAAHPKRWYWDPLRDARGGGMGQLAAAVRDRVAPFLGFCGGAQILALFEARRVSFTSSPDDDQRLIDLVLRRTNGRPIRGFGSSADVERSWPGDLRSRASGRSLSARGPALCRSGRAPSPIHDASLARVARGCHPSGCLSGRRAARGGFKVVATSAFCGTAVVAASARDGVYANPFGPGSCDTVPQAFRTRDDSWPVIGTQFHAEQRDFSTEAPGDPSESVADPRLFLAAAYEDIVDAYVRLGR